MTPHLTKVAKAMLRRVFVCGNAGYFHDEVAGENWGGRKHSLVVLEKQGLLRSSRAKAPPRLLWHLDPADAGLVAPDHAERGVVAAGGQAGQCQGRGTCALVMDHGAHGVVANLDPPPVCSQHRWCWEQPRPTGRTLRSQTWGFDGRTIVADQRYDDLGRPIEVAPEGGDPVTIDYDPRLGAGGSVTGLSVLTSFGSGAKTRSDHDELGRPVVRAHRGFDGSWIEEATRYDLLGRPVLQTRPGFGAPSTAARGRVRVKVLP